MSKQEYVLYFLFHERMLEVWILMNVAGRTANLSRRQGLDI